MRWLAPSLRGGVAQGLLVAFPLLCAAVAPAQVLDLPPRIDTEWVLKYEQAYGVAGLYVEEPAPVAADRAGRVRADLLKLTKAGRQFAERVPTKEPTVETLVATGFLDAPIAPPDGATFAWSPETRRFLCSLGGEYDLTFGALAQLTAAEVYRKRVFDGGSRVMRAWSALEKMEGLPSSIPRELETRRFAIAMTDYQGMRDLERTQELLGQLADAIEFATATGTFKKGQAIEMQDVGRTGLISTLEALPHNGVYKVTTVGEPPVAVFGEVEVPFGPQAIARRMAADAEAALAKRPDYPPAMALAARHRGGAEGMALIDKAVATWPDTMALRVQRLAMNAERLNLEALNADLDYVLARFPAAPLLLEIDVATRKGPLASEPQFRSAIALAMADIRPEVLNMQLIAYRELLAAGRADEAARIRKRIVEKHPGYEPLIKSGS